MASIYYPCVYVDFFPLAGKFHFGQIRLRILGRLIQHRQIYSLFMLDEEEEIF